jgi:Spy/CpxP family protein refolding chaperone
MRTNFPTVLFLCLLPLAGWAQAPPAPIPEPGSGMPGPVTAGVMGPKFQKRIVVRREMGRWWKDPETAKKLQLNDGQISQLDQIFYEHRLKLIDYGAAMEKEDLKLQNLLDADVPNEGQISSQVDQVLSARGKLEREYTMMSLDLRKVLSLDQWRQLKTIREERGPKDNFFFYKQLGPGPPSPATPLPPPPPPGDTF